ncbi:unnamed protein product, partial [marine sediment metagenome]
KISLADLAAPHAPGSLIPLQSLGVNFDSPGME